MNYFRNPAQCKYQFRLVNTKQIQTRADQADKMYKYFEADLFKALKMRSDY